MPVEILDFLKQKIIEDYKNGMTMKQVAVKYNVSVTSVYRITKSAGVNRNLHVTGEKLSKILELYRNGELVENIATITGISCSSIIQHVNKHIPEYRRRHNNNNYTEHDRQIVVSLYISGYAPKQISSLTGFKTNTIRGWVKKSGNVRPLIHAQRGKRGSNYKNGMSSFPYCERFDNGLKERVISWFEYRCVLCGKYEDDMTQRMCVHHVFDNPDACCNKESPRVFTSLCRSCHSKVRRGILPKYRNELHSILYTGNDTIKTYYTEEEYHEKFKRCPYEFYLHRQKILKKKKVKLTS